MLSRHSVRSKLILTAVSVLALGSAPAALAVVHRPASLPANCVPQADSVACTFGFTGVEQTFAVPAGVGSLRVTAAGAAGGSPLDRHRAGQVPGGRGAVVSGTVAVTPGSTLYIEVGGPGGTDGQAGFNGGGQAATDSLPGAGGTDGANRVSAGTGTYANGGRGYGGGGGGGLFGGGGGGLGIAGITDSGSGGGGGGSSLVPPGGTVALAAGAASVVITYTPVP